jgi:ornithine carbamoyltransferase
MATDLLTINDLTRADLAALLTLADRIKAGPAKYAKALRGQHVVMLFEKPSLRTRVSFEIGVSKLGGHALYYDHSKERIGQRESVHDYAKVLERYCDAIVARVFSQAALEELAEHAQVPVVNALSDDHHPCQALADVMTLRERFGKIKGLKVAYIGDGNNVALSLVQAAGKLGADCVVITPKGFEVKAELITAADEEAGNAGGSVCSSNNPADVTGAHCVYTDTWVSMHQSDAGEREKKFAGFQVNGELMKSAGAKAIFMHCLPAHRGHEVADEVMDSPASAIFDQAENRMWAQCALLMTLMGKK